MTAGGGRRRSEACGRRERGSSGADISLFGFSFDDQEKTVVP